LLLSVFPDQVMRPGPLMWRGTKWVSLCAERTTGLLPGPSSVEGGEWVDD